MVVIYVNTEDPGVSRGTESNQNSPAAAGLVAPVASLKPSLCGQT